MDGWRWLQFILSFGLVIGLAYYLSRFLGQRFMPGKQKDLRLLESMPLGGRRFLALVELRDQVLLLGVTDQTITRLTGLEEAKPAEWGQRDV